MILALDDETHYVEMYIEDLQWTGFETVMFTGVDAASEFFDSHLASIELCLIDIMISPGTLFRSEDTLMGRRTGFRFYDYIRQRAPMMPVVVLTNVEAPDIQAKFGKEPFCWWFRKDQCLPYELSAQIHAMLRVTV